LAALTACSAGEPVDNGSGVIGCTCRLANIRISIRVAGMPAEPDTLEITAEDWIDYGDTGMVFVPVADVGESVGVGEYLVEYDGKTCEVRATVGADTRALRCEDHSEGPHECVCGEDASLAFAF